MIIKKVMAVIVWIIIIGLLLFQPDILADLLGWLSAGFFALLLIMLLGLYLSYIFYKTKEAKEEGGWLITIITFIGLVLLFVFWFFKASNSDKSILP